MGDLVAAAGEWRPPDRFDEYRLIRPLGRGSFGKVYLAQDEVLDRPVAIKIVTHLRDDSVRARFLVEARAIARIRHPNVLSIHRVGELDGHPFLVSEYVHGTRVDMLVGLSFDKLLDTAIGLARGLAAAHRAGVLHRDVKPENAIVDEAGLVKLLDFGLAKFDERATFQPARTGEPFPIIRLPTPALDRTLTLGEVSAAGEASDSLFVTAVFSPPDTSEATATPAGEAGNLTGAGQVLGTPNYLSPERWVGQPATARSDVYSLGVLLFQLACGRLPFRPQSVADIARLATHSDAPPLASMNRTLPDAFCQVVDRCLSREPERRPASGDAVREALEVLLVKPRAASAPHRGNPYRGLEVFEARHSELFFGRSAEVRAVVDRLRTTGSVVVAGDSGLGKSSLCRAGVIPAIERGALEDGRVWRSLVLVPGAAPVRTLATFLADHLRTGEADIEHLLVEDPEEIGRRLRQLQERDEGLLIFIDQLEEAFTVADDQARSAFLSVIARLSEPSPSLRLLASIRGDFVTRLGESEELGDQAVASLYFLRPLGPSGLREAVLGPAEATGVRFEPPALVDQLLAATTSDSGGLPLLQFALAELWERRDRERGVITAEHLRELGGVRGALERHADGLIDRMSQKQRELARRIILSLVTEHSTRARRRESELSAGEPEQRAVLQMMVRGRLLVAREQEGETAYEIAHEVLLRDWGRLRDWLSADAGARLVVARVERAAGEWRRLGESRDALWGDRQLSELTPVVIAALAAGEEDFVAASRRRLRARRRWRIALWAAVGLAPLVAWAAVTLRDDWRRDHDVKRALDDSAAVAVRARTATAEARRLRGRAFSWFDTGKWEDGEREWAAARDATAEADAALGRAALTVEEIVSLAPKRPDVRRRLTEILIERSRWAEEVGELARRDELLERIQLYDPDGVLSRGLRTPAQVSLSIDPASAEVAVSRFERGEGGRLERRAEQPVPWAGRVELAPGSYVLAISAPGYHAARLPLYLRAGESVSVDVHLPPALAARAGMVYLPSTRFLVGAGGDEALRREYLHAAPQHETVLPPFFIALHETTYGEYVAFLDALPAAERAGRRPRASSIGFHGFVELVAGSGGWTLAMQPGASKLSAAWGQPIRYPERSEHAQNDWRNLPVTGVSMADAEAYAAWLDKSGQTPGARLCDEREWELAARGADGRRYPHGAALRPADANIGESHGELGPDEVGSHPASDSVVGLHDMAGNAWELTRSAVDGKPVARGGSYALDPLAASSAMREQPEQAGLRDITVGFRVCASAQDD